MNPSKRLLKWIGALACMSINEKQPLNFKGVPIFFEVLFKGIPIFLTVSLKGFLFVLKVLLKGFLSFLKALLKGFLSFLKAFLKVFLSFLKAFSKGFLSFFKAFLKGFLREPWERIGISLNSGQNAKFGDFMLFWKFKLDMLSWSFGMYVHCVYWHWRTIGELLAN